MLAQQYYILLQGDYKENKSEHTQLDKATT